MRTALLLLLHVANARELHHRYFALRHGQSLANTAGIISSDPDIATIEHGLSDLGWEQASAAARAVCDEAAASGCSGVAIVSSDFKRAWQTAQAVRAGCLAAGVRVWPANGVKQEQALRERSFGELNGCSDTRYDDVWVEDAQSSSHEQYAVESIDSVLDRACNVVEWLEGCDELSSGTWMGVLVAHGDVLQILQTAFAGVDPRSHRSLEHLPTATLRPLGLKISSR